MPPAPSSAEQGRHGKRSTDLGWDGCARGFLFLARMCGGDKRAAPDRTEYVARKDRPAVRLSTDGTIKRATFHFQSATRPKNFRVFYTAPQPVSDADARRPSGTPRACHSAEATQTGWRRSAVPAGTRARLLLTYIRLVEGGRLQQDRRARVQRDAKGAPGAAQKDHKRRVERARAQSAAEGLLLPAEHGSRPVSAQGLRRRGRAIAQVERESAQGDGAAGEEGESSMGAARAAACAPAVAGAAAAGAIAGDVQDGEHGNPDHAMQGACSGQGRQGSVSSRARTGQGARQLQGAARQGGIAMHSHGEVAAVVDTWAENGSKEQMAMDGSAPAAWQVDLEHRDGDEGEVDTLGVEEDAEHHVVQQRDDEHVDSAAATRAGRAGPSKRASGRRAGLRSSKKEEKEERP